MRHHGAGLLRASGDSLLAQAVMTGNLPDQLIERDKAIIDYARRLTLLPASISPKDIESLRQQGLGDRAILEINLAAAYMNFVNRIALGLGVEAEMNLDQFQR